MSWTPDDRWSLKILRNYMREDALNVAMAIEHAVSVLEKKLRDGESAEPAGEDEILMAALREHQDGG
jgi:hypothetical protein